LSKNGTEYSKHHYTRCCELPLENGKYFIELIEECDIDNLSLRENQITKEWRDRGINVLNVVKNVHCNKLKTRGNVNK
jgi:hypothetical protein